MTEYKLSFFDMSGNKQLDLYINCTLSDVTSFCVKNLAMDKLPLFIIVKSEKSLDGYKFQLIKNNVVRRTPIILHDEFYYINDKSKPTRSFDGITGKLII